MRAVVDAYLTEVVNAERDLSRRAWPLDAPEKETDRAKRRSQEVGRATGNVGYRDAHVEAEARSKN